ncbi:MAG: hypothetical protein HYV29_08095 [Ignavibacteriales bacterium]|nr:hypothetical protein [Ignavibacteriales bacterium]
MLIIPGGYKKIEFDENIDFSTAIEIEKVLKEGTQLTPGTPTEIFSQNLPGSVLKRMDVNIRSADNYDSIGSAYQRLKAAEESRTVVHFKFTLLNGYLFYLYNVHVITWREMKEVYKFNALHVFGIALADTEALLYSLASGSWNMASENVYMNSETLFMNQD